MRALHAVLLGVCCWGSFWAAHADLVRVDLSGQKAWRLTNSNFSVDLPATVPAHTLSVLASAGVIADDPLFRYGERDTRWVGEERWNFTLLWSGKKHAMLSGCREVMLVLYGIDTFGSVVLNGRHVLEADNAHRSYWVPLSGPEALRDSANMLSVVLQPAAAAAQRAKAAYPYPVPTMQVLGGINAYNFARKPAFDFGWDWGPAFVPAGITGGVELVGFDRATLIGALVTQAFNASRQTYDLTVTGQFVVPAEGDSGTLSVTLAVLDLHKEQQVTLQPGVVGGNPQQALASITLQVPASRVKPWQPLTLAPKGKPRELYDLAVMFEPTITQHHSSSSSQQPSSCGVAPDHRQQHSAHTALPEHSAHTAPPAPDIRSTVVRRVGFRTVELVRRPIQEAAQELNRQQHDDKGAPQQPQLHGESFYLKINDVPLYAKGANLIPLHVLSTMVSEADVRAALQTAVDANMNMVRIWGGGRYQVDELYEAADELGLMVWQEAMFACSPYPRNAAFLATVEAEVTQQLLRLGSHPSVVVFGGNNEVEQSLEWYKESRGNLALYATDYSTLFVDTIGRLVQQMLLTTPWLDSSPSRGVMLLPASPGFQTPATAAQHSSTTAASTAAQQEAVSSQAAVEVADDAGEPEPEPDPADTLPGNSRQQAASDGSPAHVTRVAAAAAVSAAAGSTAVKRWGHTNDPTIGDVHFYNYRDDCQDPRTYPAARFISEYGWQSYPSWNTYAAATAEEDWQLLSDMTEYRQRHPNGTVELLAQLNRRFTLPQAWLQLLPKQHDHTGQQTSPAAPAPAAAAAAATAAGPGPNTAADEASPTSGLVANVLQRLHQHTISWLQHLQDWRGLKTGVDSTTTASSSSSRTAATSPATVLTVGSWQGDTAAAAAAAAAADEGNILRRRLAQQSDMAHYIYLTQLQQMLCYTTALQTWRRLRSEPSALTMGVLYWQLNDVWAGASWSSVDYGGVWKPVHYGVARAFADVALSVQHDFEADTVTVFVVNDLQQPVSVRLAVRLLSLTDTPAHCSIISSDNTMTTASSSTTSSSSSSQHKAAASERPFSAAPYVRYHTTLQDDAPAAAATQLWSAAVGPLIKAGRQCSRTSCYLHISLLPDQHTMQEATVWLAPFKELPLRDPQLAVDVQPPEGKAGRPAAAAAAAASGGGGGRVSQDPEAVSIRVSSQAVAVYAVLEVEAEGPAGRFSDNALTVHPCEPQEVLFVPRAAARPVQQGVRGSAADAGLSSHGNQPRSSSSSSSRVLAADGSSVADEAGWRVEGSAGGGDEASSGSRAGHGASQQSVLQLLQEGLVVSSLWDHQQFDQQQHEAIVAV